jgi:hypothetical protein
MAYFRRWGGCMPMRVMFVPESVQIVDSVEFAEQLHATRARQLNRAGDEHAGLHVPLQTSFYLVAYMAWPNDETRRDQWIAALRAERHLATAEAEGLLNQPDNVGLKLLAKPASAARMSEIADLQTAWTAVADVFQRLIDMATDEHLSLRRGPSVSKAIALCAVDKTYGRAQVERFWSQYRDVAHLITAAAWLASRDTSGGSIFSVVWLSPDAVIGIADGFEYFGLSTKPHGSTDTFLRSKTTWRLPDHCCKEKPFLIKRSLSAEQRQFLQHRKSRKEYVGKPK